LFVGGRQHVNGTEMPLAGTDLVMRPEQLGGELDCIIPRWLVIGENNVGLLTNNVLVSDLKRYSRASSTPSSLRERACCPAALARLHPVARPSEPVSADYSTLAGILAADMSGRAT
jgi:hypothetical protein